MYDIRQKLCNFEYLSTFVSRYDYLFLNIIMVFAMYCGINEISYIHKTV